MARTDPRPDASGVDAELLDACRRGERDALDRVFRERIPPLRRMLVRLLGPGADVDDVVQTTVVQAIRAFPRFRGEASLDTWLGRIAVHAARRHFGRQRPRARVPLELVPQADEPSDPGPTPDRTVDDRRTAERLYHHLGRLGAAQRLALLLHVVEGLPVERVAALMGAGRLTTKSRIYWALRTLRGHAAKDPALRDLLGRGGGRGP